MVIISLVGVNFPTCEHERYGYHHLSVLTFRLVSTNIMVIISLVGVNFPTCEHEHYGYHLTCRC